MQLESAPALERCGAVLTSPGNNSSSQVRPTGPTVRRPALQSSRSKRFIVSAAMQLMRYVLIALICCSTLQIAIHAAPPGVAPAIRLADLPRHPETACASQPVKSALFSCKLLGPTAKCCKGLDAVLANSSSPSFGCLCVPKVLYGTITQASKLGLDVLTLLKSCKANATPTRPFVTEWAVRDDTTCPRIPLDARMGDLMAGFGDAVIVPSSMSRPQWAWGNMLQFGEVMGELTDLQSVSDKLFGSKTLQLLFLVMICVPLAFFLLHHMVLMRFSSAYRRLGQADRLISCQHAVYAVVFGLSLVPQTALAIRSLFLAWTGTYLVSAELSVLAGVFIPTRAVLYVGEAAVRSVVKWSWLLVVHHLLFFTIVVMAVWSQSAAIVGIGVVLDLFACHEAPLYVALLAYRLQWPAKAARGILRGACVWYVITRLVQTVLLVYMIVGFARMPAVRYTPEFIVTSILCGAFSVIQAYTLVIYRAIDVKLGRKLSGASNMPAGGSVGQGAAFATAASAASSLGTNGCDDVAVDITAGPGSDGNDGGKVV